MTTKRNYNEIDDTESGFGSAESDHSPPEVKNFRFENGDIIDDQDGGGQATTRTSARIVQRTKDELKESGNDLTEEAINAIQNDHSQYVSLIIFKYEIWVICGSFLGTCRLVNLVLWQFLVAF